MLKQHFCVRKSLCLIFAINSMCHMNKRQSDTVQLPEAKFCNSAWKNTEKCFKSGVVGRKRIRYSNYSVSNLNLMIYRLLFLANVDLCCLTASLASQLKISCLSTPCKQRGYISHPPSCKDEQMVEFLASFIFREQLVSVYNNPFLYCK